MVTHYEYAVVYLNGIDPAVPNLGRLSVLAGALTYIHAAPPYADNEHLLLP